jgi:hypothetical protein
MPDLYAKCGNNCGRCVLYAGNLTDSQRQRVADGMARYHNWKPKPQSLRACAGCQTDQGFHYLKNCRVRLCAQHSTIDTCASCSVFPCSDVGQVSVGEDYRQSVAERLGEPVPEDEYLAFIEPYEGMKHLQMLRATLSPDEMVAPPPVRPLRARLVPFPAGLPLPDDEVKGLESLHSLLTAILQASASLRVRQVLFKQRRKHVLSLLWVFGSHAQISQNGSQLVIESSVHDKDPALRGIVRKRDNTLHSAIIAGAELLAPLGASVEHSPQPGKAWHLTLILDPGAGGPPALRALRRYVTALIEVYGEPDYGSASNFKGEAFTSFSRADMRVLGEAQSP